MMVFGGQRNMFAMHPIRIYQFWFLEGFFQSSDDRETYSFAEI